MFRVTIFHSSIPVTTRQLDLFSGAYLNNIKFSVFDIYIYIFNRIWVDTRWQQCSTHLHTNSTQNTENGTYISKN
jgi:hypothetical protein